MDRLVYRRKMIQSGEVIEIEAYPVYIKADNSRTEKANKSRPAQAALNDKHSLKNLERMINTNFCPGKDYFVTLTFDSDHLPESVTEARKILKRYLQRLRRAAKKSGKELKWVAVIELDGRYHFHLIISGVSPMDIMSLWGDEVKAYNGSKEFITYGKIDVSPLMRVDGSFNALAKYHAKHGKNKKGERVGGCKTWTCSRNLEKPKVTVSDTAITERRVRELIVQHDEGELLKLLKSSIRDSYSAAEFEGGNVEEYDDWQYLERGYQINDLSGFYLYVTYTRRRL